MNNPRNAAKKKILIAINCMNIGGAPAVALNQLRGLDRTRFDPWLLVLYPSKPANFLSEAQEAVGKERVIEFTLARRSLLDMITLLNIYRFLRREQFDTVVTHLFLANLIIRSLAILARIPRIIAYEHSRYEGKHLWQKVADWLLAQWTDHIVVAHEEIARFTAQQEHIPVRRFVIIPNPVSIPAQDDARLREVREAWNVPTNRMVFLSIGRFSDEKGHLNLIHAAAKAATAEKDILVLIIGHGPRYDELARAVSAAGIEESCHIIRDPERARHAYYLADVFVLPSLREGESIVTREALLAGLPVIASDLPTLHSLVEGAGWLVSPGDVDALAQAMLEAARQPELCTRFSRVARDKAQAFDNESALCEFERLLS
ncbi:MAG: glycosyltransferase [Candidatus Paceibacterota bacterium]|jgi:glycosyltransferase involved in cell wall biosynthesis